MMRHAFGLELTPSQTSPSKANGVYGLKPTGGLIPIMGIIPISLRQDCVGPMGKSALDLAIMLSVMTCTDYTSPLRRESLIIGQYRLGVSRIEFEPTERYPAPLDTDADDLFDQAVEAIQAGVVTEDVEIEAFAELHKDWQNKGWKDGRWIGRLADLLLTHELEPAMNSYLERTTGNIKSLAELIKWNNDYPVSTSFSPVK
jgi:amidase